MKITIFGCSKPLPQHTVYQDAYLLGQLLAQMGQTVITGGYMGTMEAASKGASEAGGHVIGVTCDEIERWRQVRPNSWVAEEWRCATLHERLITLIAGCDAAIALPGGPGTLAEISMMWNQLIIAAIPPRPLVLIGRGWQNTMAAFKEQLGEYIRDTDHTWLIYAANVKEAAQVLQNYINEREGKHD